MMKTESGLRLTDVFMSITDPRQTMASTLERAIQFDSQQQSQRQQAL